MLVRSAVRLIAVGSLDADLARVSPVPAQMSQRDALAMRCGPMAVGFCGHTACRKGSVRLCCSPEAKTPSVARASAIGNCPTDDARGCGQAMCRCEGQGVSLSLSLCVCVCVCVCVCTGGAGGSRCCSKAARTVSGHWRCFWASTLTRITRPPCRNTWAAHVFKSPQYSDFIQ